MLTLSLTHRIRRLDFYINSGQKSLISGRMGLLIMELFTDLILYFFVIDLEVRLG